MAIGRMIGNEIEDNLDSIRVRRPHQLTKIIQRSKQRIDVAIVADVVAEISHWRRVDRRDPDGVDAEPGQVIEPRGNAFQVADTVVVSVLKRARIDLIDNTVFPPDRFWRIETTHAATGATPFEKLDDPESAEQLENRNQHDQHADGRHQAARRNALDDPPAERCRQYAAKNKREKVFERH